MGGPRAELTKILYRSILRFANASHEVPYKLKPIHVAELVPHLGSLAAGDLDGGQAIKQLARQSFRHNKAIEVGSLPCLYCCSHGDSSSASPTVHSNALMD